MWLNLQLQLIASAATSQNLGKKKTLGWGAIWIRFSHHTLLEFPVLIPKCADMRTRYSSNPNRHLNAIIVFSSRIMVFCSSIWAFVFHRFRYLLPSSARQPFAKRAWTLGDKRKSGAIVRNAIKSPELASEVLEFVQILKAHFFSGFSEIKRKYFGF